jgi:hypothetical protein
MMHTLSWPTLQERRIKARLQMFHNFLYEGFLIFAYRGHLQALKVRDLKLYV